MLWKCQKTEITVFMRILYHQGLQELSTPARSQAAARCGEVWGHGPQSDLEDAFQVLFTATYDPLDELPTARTWPSTQSD